MCHPVSTWSYTPNDCSRSCSKSNLCHSVTKKKGVPPVLLGLRVTQWRSTSLVREWCDNLGHGFLGWTTKDPKSVVVCQCLSVACPWGPLSTKLYWFQFVSRLQLLRRHVARQRELIGCMSPLSVHINLLLESFCGDGRLWKSIRFGAKELWYPL